VPRKPKYWHTLEASKAEAILAVDLYNGPYERRSLEAFIVHMHLAWLYLLHAEFIRDGVDIRYWNRSKSRLIRVHGEPKTWELSRCVKKRWGEKDPVRKNLELFIGLRDRIEHRYAAAISVAIAGHAQAHVLNFEQELVEQFGKEHSLAETLRFPVFLSSLTEQGAEALRKLRASLPPKATRYLEDFYDSLEPGIVEDQQFEFRIRLIPYLGPPSQADLAVQFVKWEDLNQEEQAILEGMGRKGIVAIKTKDRPVQNLGLFKPKGVVQAVRKEVPSFTMGDFIWWWKELKVRPPRFSPKPRETDQRYCVYDEPHNDYLYTEAYVRMLIREENKLAQE
jgi:hypothetical protein